MLDEILIRYNRHILLNQIDIKNQDKILKSKIIIIGCGGLGNIVASYLASSGIGNLLLIDDDKIELSNLQRQIVFTEKDIGKSKAKILAKKLKERNSTIKINYINKRIDEIKLTNLATKYDLLIDCTDNFNAHYLINKAMITTKTTLIYGAASGFDGQITTFNPNLDYSPCLSCIFPKNSQLNNYQYNCANYGVFAPLVGVIASIQASEALKSIINIGNVLVGTLKQYNILTNTFYDITINKNDNCTECNMKK